MNKTLFDRNRRAEISINSSLMPRKKTLIRSFDYWTKTVNELYLACVTGTSILYFSNRLFQVHKNPNYDMDDLTFNDESFDEIYYQCFAYSENKVYSRSG